MVAHIPAVGSLVDEAQMYELIGGAAAVDRFAVSGADVLLGPAGTAVITQAGDDAGRSGVWSAGEVRVLGPAPAPVTERLVGRPATRGTDDTTLPLHLLARVDEGLLYLGSGRLGMAHTEHGPDHLTEQQLISCALRPDAPLDKVVLDRVRPVGATADLPGLAWLGSVNSDRGAALKEFTTAWHSTTVVAATASGPFHADLPQPLRDFYRLAQQRPAALGVQNYILPPSKIRADGEFLTFGFENQGCFDWSLRWMPGEPQADPTVWFRADNDNPVAEQEPLSGFLIQFALYEAAMGAEFLATALGVTPQQLEQLTAGLVRVPLRPFLPWTPTDFYVAPGLVMHIGRSDDEQFEIWAGAAHRSALLALADSDIDWNTFDG
ncbi:hypothetical protein ACIBI4_04555 [Streptomyces sp. NPDC050418]|uniref:hypothetical protein n=1 Tax=Streptomyces sp. NPDC050418 TaxID=3365612 RepID=UPI00378DFD3A